jgi:tape measure domain-containing protein
MAGSIANLNVKLTANISAFSSAMARAGRPLASFGASVAGVGMKVAGLAAALGGGALVAGVTGLGIKAVKLAADAEQAKVAFTTMLGSAEKAKQLQDQINQFAASTPFQTTELIAASKSLLAFGVAQDQIIPTMQTLGDLSAGLNVPLGDLAEIFGKAKVQGRLMAEDINQLTGRGIPVIKQFAKQFGVAEGDVKKLVEQGKIGFPHLQQALADLTAEGGQFGGMMAAQSKTVSGLWSTMTDTIDLSLTKMGQTITEKMDLRGVIGGITESMSALADAALPVLEQFIGGLAEGGNMGERAGSMVLTGAEWISTGIAYAMNAVDLIAAGWRAAQAGVAYAIGGILKAIDWMGDGVVKLLNMLPGVQLEWTDTFSQMGDALIEEGDRLGGLAIDNLDSFSDGHRTKAVGEFFDTVRANAAKAKTATEDVGKAAEKTGMKIEAAAAVQNTKVKELLDDMRKQVAEFNMTAAQKLGEQVKTAGGTDADVDAAMGMQGQLDAMEKAKEKAADLAQAAKGIIDAQQTPVEKYDAEIGKLSELRAAGLLTWDQYGRAVRAAREELEQTAMAGVPDAPELFKAGTAAAQKFVFDQTKGNNRLTRDDVAKEQLAEQRDGTRALERIEQNTRPGIAAGSVQVAEIAL